MVSPPLLLSATVLFSGSLGQARILGRPLCVTLCELCSSSKTRFPHAEAGPYSTHFLKLPWSPDGAALSSGPGEGRVTQTSKNVNFLPRNLDSFSFPNVGLEKKGLRKARAWGSSLEAASQGDVASPSGILAPSPLFGFLCRWFVLALWTCLGPGDALRQSKPCKEPYESWQVPRPCGQRGFAVFKKKKVGRGGGVLGAEWLEWCQEPWACGHYRDSTA